MGRAVLRVEAAGPLTTVQDEGRFGHLRHGVTWSGPIDRGAFAGAHAAVGNAGGGPAVEVSRGGIALSCVEGEVKFALTGGDFAASLDDVLLGSWMTGVLRAGSRLVVRDGLVGNWGVLAFGGRVESRVWLGSSATLALAGLGGGRLIAGDVLVIEAAPAGENGVAPVVKPVVETGPLRVILGPQEQYFAPETVDDLLNATFVAGDFDRMGLVLGGVLLPPLSITMLSAPVLRGSVQVNGAGTATILLADHQTTAGYPRIATVIGADLDRAAQARTGETVRFAAVSVAQANAIAREAAAARGAWLGRVAAGQGSLLARLMAANLIDGVVDARE